MHTDNYKIFLYHLFLVKNYYLEIIKGCKNFRLHYPNWFSDWVRKIHCVWNILDTKDI